MDFDQDIDLTHEQIYQQLADPARPVRVIRGDRKLTRAQLTDQVRQSYEVLCWRALSGAHDVQVDRNIIFTIGTPGQDLDNA